MADEEVEVVACTSLILASVGAAIAISDAAIRFHAISVSSSVKFTLESHKTGSFCINDILVAKLKILHVVNLSCTK